jgi:regulator of protease activity HflC (stomatin/prohibitin superfamily)
VLALGREAIASSAKLEIQSMLDEFEAGVEIVTVKLQSTAPPEQVRDAFQEVNRARQNKRKVVNEAEGERNSQIPAARGKNKQAILEIVYELAERAGAADPEALSEELCMIMDGAYVGRQVMGEPGTIRIARGLAERAIQAHLDPDPARAGGISEPASS